MKKSQLLIVLVLIWSVSVYGQKDPAVFGKIDIEDLRMTTYEPDSSAPALVLCDFGWFSSSNLQFTRLLRIKILRKEGYVYSDKKYVTSSRPTIKALTYNLIGDEVVKEKLKSNEVYIKQLASGLYETSFAMPNVTEGSVIDIEYVFAGMPSEWKFQWTIPVRHSELVLQHSSYVEFTKNYFGYIPMNISEPTRWVAQNIPAFKPEPFIDSEENYISKFEIMLKSFVGFEVNTTWDNINTLLLYARSFPSVSGLSVCLTPVVSELKKSGLEGEDLIRSAFEKAKEIKYNEENSLFISEEGLCAKHKMGSGNSADVNAVLIQLLNRLGIDCYPVVLSTRDNGIISEFSPSVNKLNYFIAGIKTDNGYRLLDATEEYLPCTLLPERCINGNGMLVRDPKPLWIPLEAAGKDKRTVIYDLRLDDDLSLNGTIVVEADEYAAYDFRKEYSKYNDTDEYLRSLEKKYPGLLITGATIDNVKDLYAPVKATYSVRIDGAVTQIDDEAYINPLLFESLSENPFKNDKRVYPVSYPRKVASTVILKLALNEKQTLKTVPSSVTGKTRSNSLTYVYKSEPGDGRIQIMYNFNVNEMTILQPQYPELREIYNQIVKKHHEPLIIKVI